MKANFSIKTKVSKKETLNHLKKALFDSMLKLQELAKRKVPVDTGLLKSKINLNPQAIGSSKYSLVAGTKYAESVEFGCFLGKGHRIKILTKRGYKSLEDVKIGDLVLTHKNRWRKVKSKPVFKVNKRIPRYSIILESGRKTTVTEEHPFLTQRGWIKAKDLSKSDEIWEVR